MEIDKVAVGNRIREIRKGYNLTMEAFGKLISNTIKGTVNNWEKGVNLPNKVAMEKIAILGHISLSELKYGDLKDYLKNLLSTVNDITLTEDFFEQLTKASKERGLGYEDNLELLREANRIEPKLIDSMNFIDLAFKNGATKYFISNYPIEENLNYRRFILPLIEDLLGANQEENQQLLSSLLAVMMKREALTNVKASQESEDLVEAISEEFESSLNNFNQQFNKKMKL